MPLKKGWSKKRRSRSQAPAPTVEPASRSRDWLQTRRRSAPERPSLENSRRTPVLARAKHAIAKKSMKLIMKFLYSRWGKITAVVVAMVGSFAAGHNWVDNVETSEVESPLSGQTLAALVASLMAVIGEIIVSFREKDTVRAAQLKEGLEADGWVGRQTRALLPPPAKKPRRVSRDSLILFPLLVLCMLVPGCGSVQQGKAKTALEAALNRYDIRPGVFPVPQLDGSIGWAGPIIVVPKKAESLEAKNPAPVVVPDMSDTSQ